MNYDAGCSTMDSSEMPPQDPTMTHQLFQLITEMSADEKRTLLKILKGGAFGGLLRKRGNKTGGNSGVGGSTMDSSEMPLQDPTMTHQLFQLITEMSADEKRIFLKILKGGAFGGLLRKRGNKTGGNSGVSGSTMDSSEMPLQDPTMTHQLFQLITEMSADEKRISLKILKGGSLKSRCRRQHLRKPVHMRVRYAGKDGISSGVIRDLSLGGMFILSRKAFSLGQGIQVAISHANLGSVVWMAGDVVRVTPEGIGLRFRSTNQIQKTAVLTIGSMQ